MEPRSTLLLPPNVNAFDAANYLASLVSDAAKVAAAEDSIKAVTSRPGFSATQLTTEESSRLRLVCWQLAVYLVSEEKMRAFTIEDLERRIEQRFLGTKTLWNLRFSLGIIMLLTSLLGFMGSQVQPPATLNGIEENTFSVLLTIPVMFTVLSLGAAWLFFAALRYFRQSLRRTYMVIMAGVALLGVAHLQLSVLAYFQQLRSGWVNDGGVGLLYIIAILLIFVGTARFAKLTAIRSWLTSWRVILLLSVVSVALVVWAPHSPALLWGEGFFDIATSTFPVGIVLSTVAAIHSYRIARKINEIYQQPMRWLGHANLLLAISVGQILFVRLVFGYDTFWTNYGFMFVPFLLASVAFLRAGYSFNKVSNY